MKDKLIVLHSDLGLLDGAKSVNGHYIVSLYNGSLTHISNSENPRTRQFLQRIIESGRL